MSAKRPDITLDLLKRILPALRMMVRFPSMPAKNISFQTAIELTDIYAYTEVRGRPKAKDIEEIEREIAEGPKPKQERATPKQIAAARRAPPSEPRHTTLSPNSARNSDTAKMQPPPATKLAAPTSDIGHWLEQQRAKITARVNCFQVEVTPAIARAWLAFNLGNRKPSRAKIRRFATAMQAGKWALNGETIKFSISGRLIDGQSRLMAIELANVPVVVEVRAGLPDVAQQSMDSGELRKGAHVLEMLGEANPAILAAALKIVWIWRKGWLGGFAFGVSRVMENGEVSTLLAECAELKASAGWVVSDGAKIDRLMTRSEAAFFHYIFGRSDRETRDAFFEALCEGIGLTKVSPVYHLRERLLAERGGPDSEPRKVMRRALIIKAWNASCAGEKVSTLAWRENEAFPAIHGLPAPERETASEKIKGGAS